MTARLRRGQQVPPPPAVNDWGLRYATKESQTFAEMERQSPGDTAEAKTRLKKSPVTRSDVQKPLRGSLGTRATGGIAMQQWQYDISSGASLWYCIDPKAHIVWLASPLWALWATAAKGKRGQGQTGKHGQTGKRANTDR